MKIMGNGNFMFWKSESGSTALIVGICLVPVLFGVLALSVDMTKAQTGANKTANAVDATAHGVAEYIQQYQIYYAQHPPASDPKGNLWQSKAPSDDQLQSYADSIFLQNISNDQSSAIPIPMGN